MYIYIYIYIYITYIYIHTLLFITNMFVWACRMLRKFSSGWNLIQKKTEKENSVLFQHWNDKTVSCFNVEAPQVNMVFYVNIEIKQLISIYMYIYIYIYIYIVVNYNKLIYYLTALQKLFAVSAWRRRRSPAQICSKLQTERK